MDGIDQERLSLGSELETLRARMRGIYVAYLYLAIPLLWLGSIILASSLPYLLEEWRYGTRPESPEVSAIVAGIACFYVSYGWAFFFAHRVVSRRWAWLLFAAHLPGLGLLIGAFGRNMDSLEAGCILVYLAILLVVLLRGAWYALRFARLAGKGDGSGNEFARAMEGSDR